MSPQITEEYQRRGLIARSLGNIDILARTLILSENHSSEIESTFRESIPTISLRPLN